MPRQVRLQGRSCPATTRDPGPPPPPRPPPTFFPSLLGAGTPGPRPPGRGRVGVGRGLVAGRGSLGSGSAGPTSRQPARGPGLPARPRPGAVPGDAGSGAGSELGSLTWTAVPRAPSGPRCPPRPHPAGPRPTDTEAEVRPAELPTDSQQQPLAAPRAVASTAACPISAQLERCAGRRGLC